MNVKSKHTKLTYSYSKTMSGGYIGIINEVGGVMSEARTLDELKVNLHDAMLTIFKFKSDTENFKMFSEICDHFLDSNVHKISNYDSKKISYFNITKLLTVDNLGRPSLGEKGNRYFQYIIIEKAKHLQAQDNPELFRQEVIKSHS